ncbi:MAG: H-NS family nucleoid-associated regulatory protein [Gammaproteobacteria bacterium]
MALPDISELSVSELEALVAACNTQIEKRRKSKRAELAREFKKQAAAEGLSLDDIMSEGEKKKATRKGRTAKGKGRASKRKGMKVAPKYANPDDSTQTWTGRGRKPAWVVAALEAGKSLDDLLI